MMAYRSPRAMVELVMRGVAEEEDYRRDGWFLSLATGARS